MRRVKDWFRRPRILLILIGYKKNMIMTIITTDTEIMTVFFMMIPPHNVSFYN